MPCPDCSPTGDYERVELVWPGKGKPVERVSWPFQTIERVNDVRRSRGGQAGLESVSRGRARNGAPPPTVEESSNGGPESGDAADRFDPETGRSDLPEWWVPGWRNRLIWGDNRQVLSSLLAEFAGKVDLIYIDPPFATGADFSYSVQVGDEDVTKLPSMMEEVAYRDAWGGGMWSYLQMLYQRILLLSELLSPDGSIYLHVGPEYSDPIGTICDEVFATASKAAAITWKRAYPYPGNRSWTNVSDVIVYRAMGRYAYDHAYSEYSPDYVKKTYPYVEEDSGRRYGLSPMGARRKGGYEYELLGVTRPWRFKEHKAIEMLESGLIVQKSPGALPQYKRYLDEMKGRLVGDLWDDIPYGAIGELERTGYETQKPERLLERVIRSSSRPGDLVLDCFAGSGTTAAVAEKLGRRWVSVDIGRFSIQTTRKRLLDIEGCRPFAVQNLGTYERKYWQTTELSVGEKGHDSVGEYFAFVLKLYGARPLRGQFGLIHGLKDGRAVHVGATDAPVTAAEINLAMAESEANGFSGLDVLGWEFEMGMNTGQGVDQIAPSSDSQVRKFRIPREILDKREVDAGEIRFYELAVAHASVCQGSDGSITVTLDDYLPKIDDYMSQQLDDAGLEWYEWVDYWAVDFEYDGEVFVNQWQAYRTRRDRSLSLVSDPHHYDSSGLKSIVVKVIDIFGNDTTVMLEHEV